MSSLSTRQRSSSALRVASFSTAPKGNTQALRNTEGWTGMLVAMKVWLEHGINAREGFYKETGLFNKP